MKVLTRRESKHTLVYLEKSSKVKTFVRNYHKTDKTTLTLSPPMAGKPAKDHKLSSLALGKAGHYFPYLEKLIYASERTHFENKTAVRFTN